MFTMMMSQCHQSKGLWNEPMIGEHIANGDPADWGIVQRPEVHGSGIEVF